VGLLVFLTVACNFPLLAKRSDTGPRYLQLGPEEHVLSQTAPPEGGVIRVEQPGSPIDGLTVSVPPGAYAESVTFDIAYQPIESHDYDDTFDPVTPLIGIENGGTTAAAYLTVGIPVQLPDGYFPLAFTYDSGTGELEGIPLLSVENGLVQLPMRHFSYVTVSMIKENLLQGEITTGFSPIRDIWTFPNEGSVAEPGGHCAGQSLSALYYFDVLREGPLATRYDGYNNPLGSTPELWEDDRLGIRLSSSAQRLLTVGGDRTGPDAAWWLQAQWNDPRITYLTFAGVMLVTERPQLVYLNSPTTGHAMIAYGAAGGDRIYIADPNYPGEERALTYDPNEGKFDAYLTGTRRGGEAISFDQVHFLRKRDAVQWESLGNLWQSFTAGNVGDNIFPAYTIWAEDPAAPPGQRFPLVDGVMTDAESLKLTFEPQGFEGKVVLYRENGEAYDAIEEGSSAAVELKDGTTTLGFLVEAKYGGEFRWVDFRWIRIERGECLASRDAYTWSYEEIEEIGGSGGTICKAKFVLTNAGAEPLHVVAYETYDNGTMKGQQWSHHPLAAGEKWEQMPVGRTVYNDGVVTYNWVAKVLVLRDVSECEKLRFEESQPFWEAQALSVEELACP
jgi:hypothetical protein